MVILSSVSSSEPAHETTVFSRQNLAVAGKVTLVVGGIIVVAANVVPLVTQNPTALVISGGIVEGVKGIAYSVIGSTYLLGWALPKYMATEMLPYAGNVLLGGG